MDDSTQLDKYQATPCEKKLLEVLLNPECRFFTVTKICKEAGINRQTYYNAFDKPGFVEYYHDSSIDFVKQSVGPIITAFTKMAVGGSFQHGKILLEMAKLHKDSVDVNSRNLNLDTTDPKEAAQAYAELVKRTER
jgi:hypothetical protein